jgi:hypothetical protein
MKTCVRCGSQKLKAGGFPPRGRTCRACVSAKTKAHCLLHRAQYKEHLDSRIIAVQVLKEGHPCVDCGDLFPPYVMDFDHRDPSTKEFQISNAVKSHVAWSRVLSEIAKCDLRCACCHRLRTQTDPKTYQHRKKRVSNLDYVMAIKSSTPCADCKRGFAPCQMDFDHVRGQKTAGISRLMDADRLTLDLEIAKCELVCANCHRIRTWSVRSVFRSGVETITQRADQPAPRWWHNLVGATSDAEVSRMAGIHTTTVRAYRNRMSIPVLPSRYTRKVAA